MYLNIFIPTPILNNILRSWTHIKGNNDVNKFTDSEFQNILSISHLRIFEGPYFCFWVMCVECLDTLRTWHPTSHVISRDPTHLVWTLNIFIPTPILNKILCSWTHIKGKKNVNTSTDSEFQNTLSISHFLVG